MDAVDAFCIAYAFADNRRCCADDARGKTIVHSMVIVGHVSDCVSGVDRDLSGPGRAWLI